MKDKTIPKLIQLAIVSCFLQLAAMTHASTTLLSTSRYAVTEGVTFTLGNSGASSFLFNWTDPAGAPPASFSSIADPTLVLTLGQTYIFQRTTSSHPFVIMDNTAAAFISGTDGAYSRTTSDGTRITNATLTPIADFTADPAPTSDFISWTPTELGDFWYTCSVTSHLGMAGAITVVPEPSVFGLIGVAVVGFAVLRYRRGSRREISN